MAAFNTHPAPRLELAQPIVTDAIVSGIQSTLVPSISGVAVKKSKSESLTDTCRLLPKLGMVLEQDPATKTAGYVQKNRLGQENSLYQGMLPLSGYLPWRYVR